MCMLWTWYGFVFVWNNGQTLICLFNASEIQSDNEMAIKSMLSQHSIRRYSELDQLKAAFCRVFVSLFIANSSSLVCCWSYAQFQYQLNRQMYPLLWHLFIDTFQIDKCLTLSTSHFLSLFFSFSCCCCCNVDYILEPSHYMQWSCFYFPFWACFQAWI